jgi:hypothetical protein
MRQSKIFILDSIEGFNQSERYKATLENDGYKVTCKPYTDSGVRIEGVKP